MSIHTFIREPRQITALCFAAAALVVSVYWPGLYGDYVFDDNPFLVNNRGIRVTSLSLSEWASAAISFPSPHQGRWLTMLSFAANYYFTGMDPFWFKATNLTIHLLNGAILCASVNALLKLWIFYQPSRWAAPGRHLILTALAIATIWLLLPINLTAVLYATQRLESLSNTFVFLGLWLYLRARLRLASEGKGLMTMIVALIGSTAAGLLAKESAVLLPLYTACIELSFARTQNYEPLRGKIVRTYGALLILPLLAGLVWLHTWIGTENSYPRQFDTTERLLTQTRVWISYIGWTLIPTPNDLTLYHDDFQISRGLLTPVTTIISVLSLSSLLLVAFSQRAHRPLLCVGILLFFSGHLLTGTVIPLEMVFEHRNYFPSVGLLLAGASLIYLEPLVQVRARAILVVTCGLICFYALSTHLRAREWSHPVRLAISEANKRPNSPRAHMELAATLLQTAGSDTKSPLYIQAKDSMETCAALSPHGTVCDIGLILYAVRTGQKPDLNLWLTIERKLKSAVPEVSDAGALENLLNCYIANECVGQHEYLGRALDAATSHPFVSYLFLFTKARYHYHLLQDPDTAEELFREIVRLRPNLGAAHVNLARILILRGKYQEAERELGILNDINHFQSLSKDIAALEQELHAAKLNSPVKRYKTPNANRPEIR